MIIVVILYQDYGNKYDVNNWYSFICVFHKGCQQIINNIVEYLLA